MVDQVAAPEAPPDEVDIGRGSEAVGSSAADSGLLPPLKAAVRAAHHLTIPLAAIFAAAGFVVLATARWNAWIGSGTVQSTDAAYARFYRYILALLLGGDFQPDLGKPDDAGLAGPPHSRLAGAN